MSGGRVPVTGANGHLGGNAIRELLDSGYTPVAFVRKGADVRALEHLDVERVVFTSSTAAVGSGASPDEVRDERHWNEDRTLPYS